MLLTVPVPAVLVAPQVFRVFTPPCLIPVCLSYAVTEPLAIPRE